MFTPNEQALLDALKLDRSSDLASLARRTGLARSSAHSALQNLIAIGVVQTQRLGGKTNYTIASRDAIERAIGNLVQQFRQAVSTGDRETQKPRLVFSDLYIPPSSHLELLRTKYEVTTYEDSPSQVPSDLLTERSKGAQVVVRFDTAPITRDYLLANPDLRALHFPTCFPENVDWEACAEFGVKTTHPDPITQNYFTNTHTEFAVHAALITVRNLKSRSEVPSYRWDQHLDEDLYGKHVGIVTARTNIRTLVEIFRAFGCEVDAATEASPPPMPTEQGIRSWSSIDELWHNSEIIIVLDGASLDVDELMARPSTPKRLVAMSSQMTLNFDSLREHLASGRLLFAVIDVQAGKTNNLEALALRDDVLITPERSILSKGSLRNSYQQTVDTLMSLEVPD